MTLIRNRADPQGHELGKHLARWCDTAEPDARLKAPELPPRCQSCAFREGPHVANGSVTTTMDALKCVLEMEPFYCHQPDREGELCAGWAMLALAREDDEKAYQAPWQFSNEVQDEVPAWSP